MHWPVLHCYADHKWTGPSEPLVRLCRGLSERGWPCTLACRRTPRGELDELATRAREAGLHVLNGFWFSRREGLLKAVGDVRRLGRLVSEGGYRLVHCHGTWDHIVAYWALKGKRPEVSLVRTDHGAREYVRGYLHRYMYGPRMTDHLIVLSDRFLVQAVDRYGRDPATVSAIRGGVDTDEFRPEPALPGMRERLGLGSDDVVIGVVSRVQRHRRFDVLVRAAALVKARSPRVKIAVCGRGTHKEDLLDRPVRRMGVGDTVVSLGYRREDYRQVLATFDAGLMLVPGSDGSCRAALQMAAMGKPLIVARRGVLPEIVRDGETGIVVEGDRAQEVAEAILEMAADAARRRAWGEAARRRMCEKFSLERQISRVEALYRALLDARPV